MASQFFGLNIGSSALSTFQVAVNTTANNIANVKTDGYSRQTTEIRSTKALRVTAKYGSTGTGVEATQITQERDLYYDDKYWTNNAKTGYYEQNLYYLNQIETIFQDDNIQDGFASIFASMFNALDSLKMNAADANVRNQFINQAQMLCTYFNSVSGQLDSIQEDCNEEIKNQVDNINSMAKKIATLNREINTIEVNGGYANELRDERANLIDKLSAVVSVETNEYEIQNTYGENLGGTNFSVVINGQMLVDGNDFYELECYVDDYANNQADITGLYEIRWKHTGTDFAATALNANGCLKALFDTRDGNNGENMKGYISDASENTLTLSGLSNTRVNSLNLLQEGVITVNSKEYVYTGWTAELDDEGNITSMILDLKDPIAENEQEYCKDSAAFCGKGVSVMGVPYYQNQINDFLRTFAELFNSIEQDGQTLDGEPMGSFFQGLTVTDTKYDFSDWKHGTGGNYPDTISSSSDCYYQLLASNFAVNKTSMKDANYFSTTKDINQGTDAYEIVEQLKDLQSGVIMFRGDKASAFLETLLSDVAVDTQKTETFYTNYSNLGNIIENMRMSISGVDEDEEALNLVKFQNAYNLASKVIQTMSELYDKLINETGV